KVAQDNIPGLFRAECNVSRVNSCPQAILRPWLIDDIVHGQAIKKEIFFRKPNCHLSSLRYRLLFLHVESRSVTPASSRRARQVYDTMIRRARRIVKSSRVYKPG